MFRGPSHQLSAHHVKLSLEDNIDRFAVGDVFLLEDAGCQGMFVVAVEYGNRLLQNDGAVIEFFIHKVHGATCNLYTVGKGLLLSLESRESWQ